MVTNTEIVERIADRIEALSQWSRGSGLHPEVLRALLMNLQSVRDDVVALRERLKPAPAPAKEPETKTNPKPAAKAPVFQK